MTTGRINQVTITPGVQRKDLQSRKSSRQTPKNVRTAKQMAGGELVFVYVTQDCEIKCEKPRQRPCRD